MYFYSQNIVLFCKNQNYKTRSHHNKKVNLYRKTLINKTVLILSKAEEGILNRGCEKLREKMSLKAKIVFCTI